MGPTSMKSLVGAWPLQKRSHEKNPSIKSPNEENPKIITDRDSPLQFF